MKTKHLLTLLLMFIMQKSFSQELAKNQANIGGTGSDQLIKLCAASDGGVLLAGHSNSNHSVFKKQNSRGGYDYWLVKTIRNETTGEIKVQWERTIGGDSTDLLLTAKPTNDNGFILLGTSFSGKSGEKSEERIGGYGDFWIVKLDGNGNIEWDKTIGTGESEFTGDIIEVSDGYVLAGGLTMGLTKINKVGEIQWQKPGDYRTIYLTNDGGYILTGLDDTRTIYVTKTDAAGNIKWSHSLGYAGVGLYSFGAIQNNEGKFIFYQRGAASRSESGGYYYDFFIQISKLDALGNIVWTFNPYPVPALDDVIRSCSLSQTKDNGYIFSTSNASVASVNPNYYLIKLNNNGDLQWDKMIMGSDSDLCTDVLEIRRGHYLVAGFSNSLVSNDKTKANIGDYDYWLVGLKDTTNITVAKAAGTTNLTTQPVLIYPNPVKDILHIQNNGKATITLTNQTGKIILSKTINGNSEINVSHLPAGLYYLRNNSNGETQKIMITK